MAKKRNIVEETKSYITYLEKKVASKNFKANVSLEEFNEEKQKLKSARFRLKLLTK